MSPFGTSLPIRNVRSLGALRGKADIGQRLPNGLRLCMHAPFGSRISDLQLPQEDDHAIRISRTGSSAAGVYCPDC
jgi:hypothetical protein